MQPNRELQWNKDLAPRKLKQISQSQIRQFGLKVNQIQIVNNLEELRKNPPGIVIAEAIKDTYFIQNWFKKQHIKKKRKYVMGLGVYQQLFISEQTNQKMLKPATIKFSKVYKPYHGQELQPDDEILVFRTGGIGDLLFIQPNLVYLKEKYDCYIKFACGPQYQSMVETWDCVDEVLMTAKYHLFFEGVIERCREAETINSYNLFSKWLGLNLPDSRLVPKQEPKKEMVDECRVILKDWRLEDNSFILMQIRASSPIRTPNPKVW